MSSWRQLEWLDRSFLPIHPNMGEPRAGQAVRIDERASDGKSKGDCLLTQIRVRERSYLSLIGRGGGSLELDSDVGGGVCSLDMKGDDHVANVRKVGLPRRLGQDAHRD